MKQTKYGARVAAPYFRAGRAPVCSTAAITLNPTGCSELAYVLVPRRFESLQAELDSTLAPFRQGGEDEFPRDKLAFDEVTDELEKLYAAKFRHNERGGFTWEAGHVGTGTY